MPEGGEVEGAGEVEEDTTTGRHTVPATDSWGIAKNSKKENAFIAMK